MSKTPWQPHIGRPRDPPTLGTSAVERAIELFDKWEREDTEPPQRQRPGRKSRKTQATAGSEKS